MWLSRVPHLVALIVLAMAAGRTLCQSTPPIYRIEKDKLERDGRIVDRIHAARKKDDKGREQLFLTLQFRVLGPDGTLAEDIKPEEFQIRENGRPVAGVVVRAPSALDNLSMVLAMDTSGSMAEGGKINEARRAGLSLLSTLRSGVKCGLIPFNHHILDEIQPTTDRQSARETIEATRAAGGTAYLDAIMSALRMLSDSKGKRAVVAMTDGNDLNSRHSLEEVIAQARELETPVYTIGVGEPGRRRRARLILVLDRSGSMNETADAGNSISKIDALKRAATRFVEIMRPESLVALLPFSSDREISPFTSDKRALAREIRRLQTSGGTYLYAAVNAAIEHMQDLSEDPDEARAVIVLTDGKDESPLRRQGLSMAVRSAHEAGVPLFTIGLGRADQFNPQVLREMAEKTGGKYHHAGSEQALYQIFEDLAIRLFDDGIDESSLRELADATGGKYFPVRDVAQLKAIYGGLADELQTSYTVTFPSLSQEYDGTARDIDISIWRGNAQVSNSLANVYHVSGVVAPAMDGVVYLVILAVLLSLLAMPRALRQIGWIGQNQIAIVKKS